MKKNILLYLFILALLALVYQQVTFKKARADKAFQLENTELKAARTAYQDTIAELNEEALDLMYFTLEHNDDALNYFENFGLNPDLIIPQIKDAIYETNFYKEQHPLVPFSSMVEGKIVINKIKMLNHRWIIADFNDGPYWGEVLIKYFVNEDKTYTFETMDAFIYPKY
jgi:hypothetical protein